MANTIQIKRNSHTGTGAPSSLAYGEIAYNNNNGAGGKLYVGGKQSNGTAQIEDITNNIVAAVPNASTDTASPVVKGLASFDADFFTVTSGNVSIGASKITATEILNGTVGTLELANSAVSGAKIANDAVTNEKIADDAVNTAQIADSAVNTARLADDAVTSAKIADDAVDSAHIAAGAIDQEHVALGQIVSTHLKSTNGSEAVTSDVIRAGAVDETALASNSVSNAKMKDNSVDTAELVNDAVTAAKIVDNITLAGNCGTSGNFSVGGNLTVTGSTTTVNSTTVTIDDVVLTLGGDTAPSSDDGFDKGVEFRYFKPTQANPGGEALIGFMGYDESLNKFTMLTEASVSSGDYSGTAGNLVVGALQASSVTGATINGGTY
jgi:hypothetical protein